MGSLATMLKVFIFLFAVVGFFVSNSEAIAYGGVEVPVISTEKIGTTTYQLRIDTSDFGPGIWIHENLIPEYEVLATSSPEAQCYPNSGGSQSFGTSTVFNVDLSVSHAGITLSGADPCDYSGYYYFLFQQFPYDGTDFYAKYYYDAEINDLVVASSTIPELSLSQSYLTRILETTIISDPVIVDATSTVDQGATSNTTWVSLTAFQYTDPKELLFQNTFTEDYELDTVTFPFRRHPSMSCSGITLTVELRTGVVDASTRGTLLATSSPIACASLYSHDGSSHSNSFSAVSITADFPEVELTGGVEYSFIVTSTGGNAMSPLFAPSGSMNASYYPNESTTDYNTGVYAYAVKYGVISGSESYAGNVEISADYFIESSEIITSISEKNPTFIAFELSKRPSTTTETRSESILPTFQGTSTVVTSFTSLEDGTYDLLVKYSNTGCGLGLSECPFPLSYIYKEFVVASGEVTSTSDSEIYNNVVVASESSQYEHCGITDIGGCINNSLRFLFIPSQESITQLLDSKDDLDSRVPFVYVSDIRTVADEFFNSTQSETLDVELDLGFGTVKLIDESMIANAPQASTIRLLLSYMLWITFAFGVYRMALGIHNKDTT